MMLLKLAIKNLLGAGLRTWLNAFVLSLSFVLIVFIQGLIQGMNKQAEEAMIASEVGGGYVQHPEPKIRARPNENARGPVSVRKSDCMVFLRQESRSAAISRISG
jgi:hypothetical protein